MSATCQVTITMSTETVQDLVASGFFLYGFAAVQSSDAAAQPLVWLQTQAYSQTTYVGWSPSYQGYTATQTGALSPGTVVSPGSSTALDLGQTLVVGANGIGTVTSTGVAGALSILNSTQTQLTCGTTQERSDGIFAGVCALPLYGGGLQIVQPLPHVLLLFSTVPTPPWTVVDMSTGPGMMIDMTNATTRAVSYDINAGWSWGGATWGSAVPAESPLPPLLVRTSQALVAEVPMTKMLVEDALVASAHIARPRVP